MLRRSRSVQSQSRGQMMTDPTSDSSFTSDADADAVAPKPRVATSYFSVPGLFVGLCAKGLSDSDSARSPTSPLEYRTFSNLGSSFVRSPSPRSPGLEGGHNPRSWDCSRVGLGLVDSLIDESEPCGKVLGLSESKNILFGSQMRINITSPKTQLDALRDDPLGAGPQSLPKDYGISSQTRLGSPYCPSDCSKVAPGSNRTELEPVEIGKIRSCSSDIGRSSLPLSRLIYHNPKSNSEVFSSDSKDSQLESPPLVRGGRNFDNLSASLPISIGSPHGVMASLSASEIELSEDYTCIISHGPNPKTTHIFGDCILGSHSFQSPDLKNKNAKVGGSPWIFNGTEASPPHSSDDFLSFCFSCKKKLEEGKDIYIYRGEKAFCSCNCRDEEILIEEQMEKPEADSIDSSFEEGIFL